MLAKRKRSIERKYAKYAADEKFRKLYKQRVISAAYLAETYSGAAAVRADFPAKAQTSEPDVQASNQVFQRTSKPDRMDNVYTREDLNGLKFQIIDVSLFQESTQSSGDDEQVRHRI